MLFHTISLLVFFEKTENLRGNGCRLKQLWCRCSGRLDLKRKRMERQARKSYLRAEEIEGPECAVSTIAYHGMAGEPGVPPDLMLAARQEVALNQGIVGASPKDPEAGLARHRISRAFGMKSPARLHC